MLCSSVYHTLMMKRGIKLIIIRGFLMISNHLKLEGTRVSQLNHIWSHTKFIPNETFLKKKNTVHLIFKILKNWIFQFINLTMNDSVNIHKAYIRSENPINPSNNPCLAIDMIYPWTLEIIENFQLHTYLLVIRLA